MLLLQPNIFKTSLFKPCQEVPISFRSLFMTSSYPWQRQPAFHVPSPRQSSIRLAIKDNLWLLVILHLKNMAYPSQPLFHYSLQKQDWTTFFVQSMLLFEIQSVSQVPRTISRQFFGKDLVNFCFPFGAPMLQIHILPLSSL